MVNCANYRSLGTKVRQYVEESKAWYEWSVWQVFLLSIVISPIKNCVRLLRVMRLVPGISQKEF